MSTNQHLSLEVLNNPLKVHRLELYFNDYLQVCFMSDLREMYDLFHKALYHLTPAIRLILINIDFLHHLAFLILKLVMPADQT